MKERKIGAVSVISSLEFVGILTERDILWKCEPDDSFLLITVESIMTPKENIVSVGSNAERWRRHGQSFAHEYVTRDLHSGDRFR